jgi:hypothetical protein
MACLLLCLGPGMGHVDGLSTWLFTPLLPSAITRPPTPRLPPVNLLAPLTLDRLFTTAAAAG